MGSYPRHYVETLPDKLAVTMSDRSESLTYAELEAKANQVANFLRSIGIQKGQRVAYVLGNCIDVFAFTWGAQRAGLYFVPVSSHLTPAEIQYIVEDSESKCVLFYDLQDDGLLEALAGDLPGVHCYKQGAATESWKSWETAVDSQPTTPVADEGCGTDMLYSSGTTGKPKGIVPTMDTGAAVDAPNVATPLFENVFSISQDCIYLCPAPLYHAAPLRWSMMTQRLGGTVVVMEKFDAEAALAAIQDFQITHAQFVPTHFSRMLQLDENVRKLYDFSGLKMAVHAAAPCPVSVKYEMLEWWGPIIYEYYGGSEGIGMTLTNSAEWLAHPGTVGRAMLGTVHICNESGDPLPVGEEGLVCFESDLSFAYHNDPAKTAEAFNKHGWGSMGDIGRLDEDGFLYLTDRKSFMIISGGVNIYPQEIENHLLSHPKVFDAAVIGMPDADFGEQVVAVVQLLNVNDAGESLKAELGAYCRESLSGIKTPRKIDFVETLPRTETGKLMKRLLLDGYQTVGD